MSISDRIRVKDVRLLSDNHYILKDHDVRMAAQQRQWQTQHRESYDRGNGATLLPYNLAKRTVILVKQFRYPAYVNGYDDLLIEAAAGLLDNASPEERIRAEAEEETGYRLARRAQDFSGLHEPGLGDGDTALLRRRIRSLDADQRRRRQCRRGRGHRGAGAFDRRGARHDRRRPHCRCQDDHAAAIRGAEDFSRSAAHTTVVPSVKREAGAATLPDV